MCPSYGYTVPSDSNLTNVRFLRVPIDRWWSSILLDSFLGRDLRSLSRTEMVQGTKVWRSEVSTLCYLTTTMFYGSNTIKQYRRDPSIMLIDIHFLILRSNFWWCMNSIVDFTFSDFVNQTRSPISLFLSVYDGPLLRHPISHLVTLINIFTNCHRRFWLV